MAVGRALEQTAEAAVELKARVLLGPSRKEKQPGTCPCRCREQNSKNNCNETSRSCSAFLLAHSKLAEGLLKEVAAVSVLKKKKNASFFLRGSYCLTNERRK